MANLVMVSSPAVLHAHIIPRWLMATSENRMLLAGLNVSLIMQAAVEADQSAVATVKADQGAVATVRAKLVAASIPAMTFTGSRYTWEGLMKCAQEQCNKGC